MLLQEDLPRGVWKMAKITELISSNDGKIRAAKVLLPTKKVLNRPINLLSTRVVSCAISTEVNAEALEHPGKKSAKIGQKIE